MGKLLQVISPGRTEIAGNHTDHEGGHVIAAALDRAIIGTFEERDDLIARVESEGREPFEIDLPAWVHGACRQHGSRRRGHLLVGRV